MIYLHKILPMVLLPIGLTAILVVAGLLLQKRALIWIGLGLLLLASTPLVADNAMRAAEGWQTRRAQLLFEQAGMAVIPFPVDFQVSQGHVFTILDLLPQADSLNRTEIALRELYGYLYYALRGAI